MEKAPHGRCQPLAKGPEIHSNTDGYAMKFNLVFESHESRDVSIGLVFVPCAAWVLGGKTLLKPHPREPHYRSGDLREVLQLPVTPAAGMPSGAGGASDRARYRAGLGFAASRSGLHLPARLYLTAMKPARNRDA